MSTQSFADLGASRAVVDALVEGGITAAFPVQRLVLPDALAGRDVLVKSPTGSGKTIAFAVPLVERLEATDPRPSALVLAPTRELACQIVDAIRPLAHARALSVAAVYGGAGIERQSKLARKAHILVATPGRLEDLIERGAVKLDQVTILVLDEADRMLDMGFRPAVDRIVGLMPRKRQTLFFSATLDGEVTRDRAGVHARPLPPRARAPPGAARGGAPPLRRGHAATRKLDALVRELRDEARGLHPRVRPHQARRRPARQAAARPRHRGARDARQQVPVPAREGAGPLRVAAAWTPSWPPT